MCQEFIVWRRKSLKKIVRNCFVEINYWERKLKLSGIECVDQNFAKAKKEAFKQKPFKIDMEWFKLELAKSFKLLG